MALSNRDRVGKALELLNEGLKAFIMREMKAGYGNSWESKARESISALAGQTDEIHYDTQALLSIMSDNWMVVFRKTLGHSERSIVSELRETRNSWAHQKGFSLDDTYRALDSMQRLLSAVSAAAEAGEIEKLKQEVLRLRFEEQTRRETQKAASVPIEGQPAGGLRPWREIVTPHPDVASGRYQQAEFAADLSQVVRGEGSDEYRKPRPFFQRTYLTEGLRQLLISAVQRLDGSGGDPVVELQTNFGGGKTHSMLALYHLFSGIPAGELPGAETLLQEAGVETLPQARIAVLVGTALSPGQPHTKPDGTVVRTLWGDLAWQLMKKGGYAMVAEADRQGVSPGSDVLRELFRVAAPCLILIDEWIAYVRQLYGVSNLPAGSFDANLTFAQALTEAAKAGPRTLVVASIPSSDIEIGGEGGQEALARLKNTFSRIESSWRPASAEEGFEIVRRRLFQPITEPNLFPARDAVVRSFMEMYRAQSNEFPSDCRETDYERRLKAAYPIHPELFDRLYNDWSSLDKFQRTRGVLRLMAAVIHALWERDDRSLLILPASVPVDDPAVQFELTRYMEEPWVPVIEKDVDGPYSLPLRIDRDNPNLGRYSAARRVTRTIYLGSAPTLHTASKGLDDQRIKLGCIQPGESAATFGDALRRLTDQATHLYLDGRRYWFSTQPSVNRLAQDRANQQTDDAIEEELLKRLKEEQKTRGDFVAVYPVASSSDIPDERDIRLVILGNQHCHNNKNSQSPAMKEAANILENRGNSPRRYRNTLVFLAPDQNRMKELEQGIRQYLAWKSIEDERVILNLDNFQSNQAITKRKQADETIVQRIPETYHWLIVPTQPDPQASSNEPIWDETRLQGSDPIAIRAFKRLRNDEFVITQLAGTRLRMELDRIPLWRGNHVSVKQLVEDFAQYLYLPRLKTPQVLLSAIQDGVASMLWADETFAWAEGLEANRQRYLGLTTGEQVKVSLEGNYLVVKSEAAKHQREADVNAKKGISRRYTTDELGKDDGVTGTGGNDDGGTGTGGNDGSGTGTDGNGGGGGTGGNGAGKKIPQKLLHRFHGTIKLDSTRVGRDASQIADAVVQHLTGLIGSEVTVTFEIEAKLPDGATENIVRTVTENCRTLRFQQFGFEED